MIKRPKGINLGFAAAIGALASLLLGTVSLSDAVGVWGNWGRCLGISRNRRIVRDARRDGFFQVGSSARGEAC